MVIALAFSFNLSISPVACGRQNAPPAGQSVLLSPEATKFLRATILFLVPKSIIDEDDWGRTKRIQSGLNVRFDGAQLRTSRRWKDVKHGEWERAEVTLLDPKERFDLHVELIPQEDTSTSVYHIHGKVRLHVEGRQQRWANGAKLYSMSGEAVADVAFSSVIQLKRKVVTFEDESRLRILPSIQSATLRLTGFRLQQVGHIKGTMATEFGHCLKSVVKRMVAHKSDKLAAKINAKIRKKPERFEIPLGVFAVLTGSADDQSRPEPN